MQASTRSITAPKGFRAAGGAIGIKASGKPDLAIIVADDPCTAAAVFTRNKICSEPVKLGREHMRNGTLRAIVCNSGNANASMGQRGLDDAKAMCVAVAQFVGCEPMDVLACSTGKIGVALPIDAITAGIATIHSQIDVSDTADADAARAIMTTDLVPKSAIREVTLDDGDVTIGAVCKGSGMIAPNMATMLAFITTDADIDQPVLHEALTAAINAPASFNRISVDVDTSPSDTVAIMASGKSSAAPFTTKDGRFDKFVEALTELCRDLAYQIVADGEGATRVIRVAVRRASSEADAVRVGRTVADSPLVKTAVHGGDPNWGRITSAVGRSGAAFDPAKIVVELGNIVVYADGGPVDTDVAALEAIMQRKEVLIGVDLAAGDAATEILGCDLSREYITINADYST